MRSTIINVNALYSARLLINRLSLERELSVSVTAFVTNPDLACQERFMEAQRLHALHLMDYMQKKMVARNYLCREG